MGPAHSHSRAPTAPQNCPEGMDPVNRHTAITPLRALHHLNQRAHSHLQSMAPCCRPCRRQQLRHDRDNDAKVEVVQAGDQEACADCLQAASPPVAALSNIFFFSMYQRAVLILFLLAPLLLTRVRLWHHPPPPAAADPPLRAHTCHPINRNKALPLTHAAACPVCAHTPTPPSPHTRMFTRPRPPPP